MHGASKGFRVECDARRIYLGHALWKNKVGRWKNDLEKNGQIKDKDKNVSDLKLAGSLLWAMNKVQPVSNISKLGQDQRDKLISVGVNCADAIDEKTLLTRFPNEAVIFSIVYHIFCFIELRRPEEKRIDFSEPPITQHFLRNFFFMLREESPGPLELYMIFKGFDLFGLKLAR